MEHRLPNAIIRSDCCFVRLASTNTYHLFDWHDKNLAIADLAGTRSLDDGLDGSVHVFRIDDDFDLDLGQEIDHVLGTTIQLGMPFLTTETLDLGDGQAGDTDFRQGLADFVELERLDDSFDFFHGLIPLRRFLKFVRISVGNRIPPILAKATRGDANADRRLPALVLGDT